MTFMRPTYAHTCLQPRKLKCKWSSAFFVENAREVTDKIPLASLKKLYRNVTRKALPPPGFSGQPHCKYLLGHPSKEGIVFKRQKNGIKKQRYCRLRDGCLYIFHRKACVVVAVVAVAAVAAVVVVFYVVCDILCVRVLCFCAMRGFSFLFLF